MRKILPLILVALFFSNCSNEIPINAEWKDIAYVYGLLDAKTDTQFVRIGKVFLGDGPAAEFAKIPDSIYYKNIVVTLVELNENETEIRRFPLDRIEKPGKLKPGAFTTEDFHLYYTTEEIEPKNIYRLEIEKPDGGPLVTAQTTVAHWDENLNNGNVERPFSTTINFMNVNNNDVLIIWSNANNASSYEGHLYFHYLEMNRNDKTDTVTKKIRYNFRPGTSNPTTSGISSGQFYGFIQNNIDPNPNVFRFFDKISLEIFAGGDELTLYAEINRPSSGIVQEKPYYTNVENGVGLFSSRASTVPLTNSIPKFFNLHEASVNELVMGLCDLNFVKVSSTDSCYCDGGVVQTIGSTTGNCFLN